MLPRSDLEAAHRHSIGHRAEFEASAVCGCFHCLATFPHGKVTEWVDWSADGRDDGGRTALCPRCGIDAVIGSASGFPPTPEFLARMEAHWFGMRGPAAS